MTTSINHNWMSYLSDNKPIREISIPGTHDSATSAYKPGYLSHKIVATPWVKTQDDNIREQLNKGVRFLDIRCRHLNNSFVIHHASFYCFCSFEDVLNMIVDFLNENTSEFILMRIRNEHKESNNNRSFCETMQTYYDTHREFFWQPGDNNDPRTMNPAFCSRNCLAKKYVLICILVNGLHDPLPTRIASFLTPIFDG